MTSFKNHRELIEAFTNKPNPDHKPRKIGRFWASEIHAIKKGYNNSKDFFTRDKIDIEGCRKILSGIMAEDMLTKIYTEMKIDCKCGKEQVKGIVNIARGIDLVVKPDFVFKEYVIETKYTFKDVGDEIPERYKDQLECEHRLTEKQTYLGLFSSPFDMRLLKYKPSNLRWENIKKTLIEYDIMLREIHEQPKL